MSEIICRFRLRARLFIRDYRTLVLYAVIFLLFLFSLGGMVTQSEERSSVPIGLVNQDDSDMAEELAERLKQNPSFYVYEESEKEAFARLREGKTELLFSINDGYGKAVEQGKKKELVEVYYLSGDSTNRVLSDIAAGEMLREICLAESYGLYHKKAPDSAADREEYYNRAKELYESGEYRLPFEYRYIAGENTDADFAGNALVYGQVIMGILLALLLLLIFFLSGNLVLERGKQVYTRLRVLPAGRWNIWLAEGLFIVAVTAGTGFLFFAVSVLLAGGVTAAAFGNGLLYLLCFMLPAAVLYVTMALLCRKLVIFEACGFLFFFIIMMKIVSNGWLISRLADILLL